MSCLISFIVPIYNLKDCILNCVNSIITNVKYSRFEIILINDGSSDGSDIVCNELTTTYSFIRTVHTINQGVSAARNEGIRIAKGEYISFVDADDLINCDPILSKEDGLMDFVVYRSFSVTEGQLQDENYSFPVELSETKLVAKDFFEHTGYFRGSVCGVIFRRDFLMKNNLFFPHGVTNGEDTIFITLVFSLGHFFCFRNDIYYLVNKRPSSASFVYTIEKVLSQIEGISVINTTVKEYNISTIDYPILRFLIYSIISNSFLRYSLCKERKNIFKLIKKIKDFDVLPISTLNMPINKWKIFLLNKSPLLFYFFIRFKR